MWNYGNPQKPISFGFFCTNSAGRFKTPILDLKVANQLIEHVATFVTRSSLVSISIWKHFTWLIKQSFGINVLLQWRHYGNPQKPISFSFSCTNRRQNSVQLSLCLACAELGKCALEMVHINKSMCCKLNKPLYLKSLSHLHKKSTKKKSV